MSEVAPPASGDPPPRKTSGLTICIRILIAVVMIAVIFDVSTVKMRKRAQINACINHLGLIDGMKQQWALEHHKQGTDTPTWQELQPYLGHGPNGELPTCPAGGVYKIGTVAEKPTCSIPEHVLP
jgi:hypothetical protein